MTSIKSSPRPNEKDSSDPEEAVEAASNGGEKAAGKRQASAEGFTLFGKSLDELLSRPPLEFDLLSQLTHMAAVSTARMDRAKLFEGTASLSYSTSKFFRLVHLVAQRLNYDYSRACETVADTVKEEPVRNLLLHFATALSAGEPEDQFLLREAGLHLETYIKRYAQSIESLQKWSDAYVAMMVSATLVVVISLVSMMIYPFSPVAIIGLAGLMVCVTFVGGWLIFIVSPVEMKTHRMKFKSVEQERAGNLAKILLPLSVIAGAGAIWLLGLPFALMIIGAVIAPVGVVALLDDWKIDARDRDISPFLRALGSVMGSAGIGVTPALTRVNGRSLGSLEEAVERLSVRLKNGISPELSWLRLAAETGSELVTRCVRIFFDGVRTGGDMEKVSALASELALKVSLARADRRMVALTFAWVALPLHAVLMGILLFVTEVVQIFGSQLANAQTQSLQGGVAAEAGVSDALLFQFPALEFIPVFVGTVAIMLTAANSFAPYAAAGGHRLKLCLYAAVMMVISGLALFVVPVLVQGIFENVSQGPDGTNVFDTESLDTGTADQDGLSP